jgi:hypothetical protein
MASVKEQGVCPVCKERKVVTKCNLCNAAFFCDDVSCGRYFEAMHFIDCPGVFVPPSSTQDETTTAVGNNTFPVAMKRAQREFDGSGIPDTPDAKRPYTDDDVEKEMQTESRGSPEISTVSAMDVVDDLSYRLASTSITDRFTDSDLINIYRMAITPLLVSPKDRSDGLYSVDEFKAVVKVLSTDPEWYRKFDDITPEILDRFDLGFFTEELYFRNHPSVAGDPLQKLYAEIMAHPDGLWGKVIDRMRRVTFNMNHGKHVYDIIARARSLQDITLIYPVASQEQHDPAQLVWIAARSCQYMRNLKVLIDARSSDVPRTRKYSASKRPVMLDTLVLRGNRTDLQRIGLVFYALPKKVEIEVYSWPRIPPSLTYYMKYAELGHTDMSTNMVIYFPSTRSDRAVYEHVTASTKNLKLGIGRVASTEQDFGALVLKRCPNLRNLQVSIWKPSQHVISLSYLHQPMLPSLRVLKIDMLPSDEQMSIMAIRHFFTWFPNITKLHVLIRNRSFRFDELFSNINDGLPRLKKLLIEDISVPGGGGEDGDTEDHVLRWQAFVANMRSYCKATLTTLAVFILDSNVELQRVPASILTLPNCSSLKDIKMIGNPSTLRAVQNPAAVSTIRIYNRVLIGDAYLQPFDLVSGRFTNIERLLVPYVTVNLMHPGLERIETANIVFLHGPFESIPNVMVIPSCTLTMVFEAYPNVSTLVLGVADSDASATIIKQLNWHLCGERTPEYDGSTDSIVIPSSLRLVVVGSQNNNIAPFVVKYATKRIPEQNNQLIRIIYMNVITEYGNLVSHINHGLSKLILQQRVGM